MPSQSVEKPSCNAQESRVQVPASQARSLTRCRREATRAIPAARQLSRYDTPNTTPISAVDSNNHDHGGTDNTPDSESSSEESVHPPAIAMSATNSGRTCSGTYRPIPCTNRRENPSFYFGKY